MAPGPCPADEVAAVPGQRAHLPGRDVETVLGVVGRVGDAAPELLPALDQNRPQSAAVMPAQQLGRDQRAAGAAADDGDRGHARALVGPSRRDHRPAAL